MSRREKWALYLIFMPYGIGAMATISRFPEIQQNLHLSNGTFGTFLSLGSIGGLLSFITIGQLVDRIGVRPVMIASSVTMALSLGSVPHIHQGWIWLIANIVFGFSTTALHISVNSQGIHRQDEIGEVVLPRFHGSWSLGALISSLIALVLTSRLTLAWQVDIVMVTTWLAVMFGILRSTPYLIKASTDPVRTNSVNFKGVINSFKFEPLISVGMVMAIQIEFATNDWSAIYAKNTIGMSASLSILTYVVFISAMISLRLTMHLLLNHFTERTLLRFIPLIGGTGFIIGILSGTYISHHNRTLGFTISLIGFMFGGFGSSFIAPVFFGIAFRKSSLPGSVVVAQLGLINAVLTFAVKIVISWVAQATSVTVALMIPGLMLYGVVYISKIGSNERITQPTT